MKEGNILIGQSGGPTSVINSSLAGIIDEARLNPNFPFILGMRWGIEGFMQDQIIDLSSEPKEIIKGLRRTPSSILGSCRYKLADSDLPLIFEQLKKYEIRFLFMIGGNDTMDTIHRIEEYCRAKNYELCGIGIPKTVDNDLYATDYTPGYPSAARYVALSVKQAGRLACDMQKVDKFVIHQTVGREAGWLAAASALAREKEGDSPHLILVPENPLNLEKFLKAAENCVQRFGFVYIVCGEGIVWEDGRPVSSSAERDKFANLEFGAMGGASAAIRLHRILKEKFGWRGEFQITESLSMCAIDRASSLDLEEAYLCGQRAVQLALAGKTGIMVTLKRQNDQVSSVFGEEQLSLVAVRAKPMPDVFLNKESFDITAKFIDYLKPLVGDLPSFVDSKYIPFKIREKIR